MHYNLLNNKDDINDEESKKGIKIQENNPKKLFIKHKKNSCFGIYFVSCVYTNPS